MATCDVDEVITSLAGETDGGAQRDAAVSSAVYQLSHHPALQTRLNLLRGARPDGCELLCVDWGKNISSNLLCVFIPFLKSLFRVAYAFCAYLCGGLRMHKCFSTSVELRGPHSCFRKLFKQLACNVPPLCMCVYLCVLPMFDYRTYGLVSARASALC